MTIDIHQTRLCHIRAFIKGKMTIFLMDSNETPPFFQLPPLTLLPRNYVLWETVGAPVNNILPCFLCQISNITWCSCRKCSNIIWKSCGSRLQTDMGSVSGKLTEYFLALLEIIILKDYESSSCFCAFCGKINNWSGKNVTLQLLVNKTLYEKTLASGFGSVHFLLDASEQQQVRSSFLMLSVHLFFEPMFCFQTNESYKCFLHQLASRSSRYVYA